MSSPQTQNLLTLTRHEEYYISSADLSILVEQVQFRVHRYFFERESAYFRKELTTPASPGVVPQGSNDSNAIILEGITPVEFAKFLWVFYNPRYSLYHAPVSDWEIILRFANNWRFPEVKKLAVRELEKKELGDVKRIALYHANAVDRNLLVPRYAALCARPEPLTLEEGMALGMETTLMIAAGREEARSRLPSGVRSPLEPTIKGADLHAAIRELFQIAPTEVADKLEVEVVEKEKEKETAGASTTGGLKKAKEADKPTQAPPTPPKAKPAPDEDTANLHTNAGIPQPPPAQQQAQQQQQGKKNKGKNQQSTPADKKAAKAAQTQAKTEKTPTSTPPSEAAAATRTARKEGGEGVVPPTPAVGQQEGQVPAQAEAEAGKEGEVKEGEARKESGPEGADEKKAAEAEVTANGDAEEAKEEVKEGEDKTDVPPSATAEPAPGDTATTTTTTTTKDETPATNDDNKTTTITNPIPSPTDTTTKATTSPTAAQPPSPIAKSPINATTPSTTTNTNGNTKSNTTPPPTSESLIDLSNGSGPTSNGGGPGAAPSQDPLDPASPPRPPPKLDTHTARPYSLASANSVNPNSANPNANVSSPSLLGEISAGLGFGSIWGQSGKKTSGSGGTFDWGLGGTYPN
ncbi:unnamed protein product [Cyclocybe aegerita]|uniref:BTB domain-containing protein n=1 Tax=Cyclocybe aegerita TaxID=1973307 RepID=A0A8S0VQL4_CYCAE|nr:unnamed protein product [Cyclocybe aegerita]